MLLQSSLGGFQRSFTEERKVVIQKKKKTTVNAFTMKSSQLLKFPVGRNRK